LPVRANVYLAGIGISVLLAAAPAMAARDDADRACVSLVPTGGGDRHATSPLPLAVAVVRSYTETRGPQRHFPAALASIGLMYRQLAVLARGFEMVSGLRATEAFAECIDGAEQSGDGGAWKRQCEQEQLRALLYAPTIGI